MAWQLERKLVPAASELLRSTIIHSGSLWGHYRLILSTSWISDEDVTLALRLCMFVCFAILRAMCQERRRRFIGGMCHEAVSPTVNRLQQSFWFCWTGLALRFGLWVSQTIRTRKYHKISCSNFWPEKEQNMFGEFLNRPRPIAGRAQQAT